MQAFPFNILGSVIFGIILMVTIFLIIYGICKVVSGFSSSRHRPFQPQPSFPAVEQRSAPRSIDPESSPIGGLCLHCGVVIEEETELHCPSCGSLRERCPICQRFVAGGQELLACPHCETVGHANEMKQWVGSKGKCPHCGQALSPYSLIKPSKSVTSS